MGFQQLHDSRFSRYTVLARNQKISVTRGFTVLEIIWIYMNYAPKNVHITFYTVTGLYACLPWWASQRSSRNFWMKLKRAHFVTAAASQTAARSSKRVHYKNVFWLLKNCFVYLRRDIVHWIKLASCSIKSLATFFANSCFLTKKTCLFILVTRLPRLHLCFTLQYIY